MPFLLMFWKPIAIAIAIATLVAACLWAKHSYDEARRDEGRAEVQATFDAYKAAQNKQRAEIILDYTAKLDKAHDDAQREAAASERRMEILDGATRNVVNTPAGVRLPADVVGVLDASSAAANARLAPADGTGQGTAHSISLPPEAAGVYDERDLAAYFKAGAAAYDDAVGKWQSCRAREDACRDARAKGNP